MDADFKNGLLRLARKSIESAFSKEPVEIPETDLRYGSFVTLRKNGELRGCIGYLEPISNIYLQVFRLAREAAFSDYRFEALGADELPICKIEISLLSLPVAIKGPDGFILKKNGIIFSLGNRRSVFLPQVAEETGWTKEELLSALSRKAGLPSDAWKDPDASFSVFTAEVFSE